MDISPSNWPETYKLLVCYHDTAYKAIDEAITLSGSEKYDQAIIKYEEGLANIDKALQVPMECPSSSDNTFEKACYMIEKMKVARKSVLGELAGCQSKRLSSRDNTQIDIDMAPPSYEEAISSGSMTSSTTGSRTPTRSVSVGSSTILSNSLTYSELGSALENLKGNVGAQSSEVVLTIENVTVYYILPSGRVTGALQPDVLKVFKLEDGHEESVPRYYLQIGTYMYPLVPTVSPCYRADFGALLLPNIDNISSEEVIGLVVPSEREDEFISLLENILQIKLVHRTVKPEEGEPLTGARRFSNILTSGASYVSTCLVSGAQKTEEFLNSNTPKIIEKLNKNAEDTAVNPKFRNGIKVARNVTAKTADVTGFVANKVGVAGSYVGKFLAPHVKKGGTSLLTSTGYSETEASRRVDDVLDVTSGVIAGYTTVLEALELSGAILGRSLSNNTAQIVEHKYGSAAGEATKDTFSTVGNSLQIGSNIRYLRPNQVVKSAAKGAFCDSGSNGTSSNARNGQRKSSEKKVAESRTTSTTGEIKKSKDGEPK